VIFPSQLQLFEILLCFGSAFGMGKTSVCKCHLCGSIATWDNGSNNWLDKKSVAEMLF